MRTAQDGRGIMKVSATTARIINGEEDLSTWTMEELRRGQKKADDQFRKKPVVVARAIHDEIVKRKMSRAYNLLRTDAWKAVGVLTEIATDRAIDPATRLKAATEVLDRTLGKPTERMDLSVDIPMWQRVMRSAITDMDGLKHHEGIIGSLPAGDVIIEGEVVEERPAPVASGVSGDDPWLDVEE